MANVSLSNIDEVIKQQSDIQEDLREILYKVQGTLGIGLAAKFSVCTDEAIEGYFMTVVDLMFKARELCTQVLEKLIKTSKEFAELS